MNQNERQLISLKSAVRDPLAAITAIEVDNQITLQALFRWLLNEIGNRPFHAFNINSGQNPGKLHEDCREIVKNWPKDAGVFCLTDSGDMDEHHNHQFWTYMNMLRENWGYLPCHLIIILLPDSYRHFLQAADHLADWVPLKFHFTEPAFEHL